MTNRGQYFGYYDEKGKWVTGQYGPNRPNAEQMALLDEHDRVYGGYADMGSWSRFLDPEYWRVAGRRALFAFGLTWRSHTSEEKFSKYWKRVKRM